LPDAAERVLDASRAATFRELAELLGGERAQESPGY
jgi:hypothetical protein